MTASPATAIVLPESEGNLLCVQFSGLVNARDHEKAVSEPIREIIARHGSYRVLILYRNFQGWEPDAADLNMKLILDCAPVCERVAYVNPPEKKILQMKLSQPLVLGEIRFFDADKLQEALDWMKTPVPTARASRRRSS